MKQFLLVFFMMACLGCIVQAQLPQKTIGGTLTTLDLDLSKDTCYLLNSCLVVPAGRTLTIEEGTTIRCATQTSVIIEQGGKIYANGTASEPVVFTSDQIAGQRNPADWGGILVSGYATNNVQNGGGDIKNVYRCGANRPGGGSNDADNSGVITYTRIEFSGGVVSGDTYVAGLTLNGVGSATLIEQVQITDCAENGMTILGGNFDLKGLFVLNASRDDLLINLGYRGNMQSVLGIRSNPSAHHSLGSNGILVYNNENTPLHTPQTYLTLSGFSLLGPGFCGATGLHTEFLDGLSFDHNGAGNYYNGVISGFRRNGLFINDQLSVNKTAADSLNVSYCSFLNNGAPYDYNSGVATWNGFGCQTTMGLWMNGGATACRELDNQLSGFTLAYDDDFCEDYCEIIGTPNFILSDATTLLDPNYDGWEPDPFFDELLYRGAIQEELQFTDWIEICPGEATYCAVALNKSNSPRPLQVSPNPSREVSAVSLTTENKGIIRLVVLDQVSGRVLRSSEQYANQAGMHKINTSFKGLKPGVYTIKAEQDGQTWYGKIVVQE